MYPAIKTKQKTPMEARVATTALKQSEYVILGRITKLMFLVRFTVDMPVLPRQSESSDFATNTTKKPSGKMYFQKT